MYLFNFSKNFQYISFNILETELNIILAYKCLYVIKNIQNKKNDNQNPLRRVGSQLSPGSYILNTTELGNECQLSGNAHQLVTTPEDAGEDSGAAESHGQVQGKSAVAQGQA